MLYETFGRLHAAIARVGREEEGQGTVEYVGLVLLVAVVMAAIYQAGFKGDAGIAEAITKKLNAAIGEVKK